jgi:hypothetical protein
MGRSSGYLCGSSVDFNRRFPLLCAMIERYPHTPMHRRALQSYQSFVYGPVCVDRRFRGRGLLRGLYRTLRTEVSGQVRHRRRVRSAGQRPFVIGARAGTRHARRRRI